MLSPETETGRNNVIVASEDEDDEIYNNLLLSPETGAISALNLSSKSDIPNLERKPSILKNGTMYSNQHSSACTTTASTKNLTRSLSSSKTSNRRIVFPDNQDELDNSRTSFADIQKSDSQASLKGLRKSNSQASLKGLRKSNSQVSFQSVNIREYDRTLGDNPSCTSGPPISLDWSYSEKGEIAINEFESSKSRGRYSTRVSKVQRENMLKFGLGIADEEIIAAKKDKKRIQRNRAISKMISPFWRVEDAVESLKRKASRKFSKKRKDGQDEHKNTQHIDLSISSNKSGISSLGCSSSSSQIFSEHVLGPESKDDSSCKSQHSSEGIRF